MASSASSAQPLASDVPEESDQGAGSAGLSGPEGGSLPAQQPSDGSVNEVPRMVRTLSSLSRDQGIAGLLDASFSPWRRRSLCLRCTSFVCFAASNMLLPLILMIQMVGLDIVLAEKTGVRRCLFFFVPVELALLGHMVWHAQSAQAVRAGSLQWVVYSWLVSAKSAVLYFLVVQKNWLLWLTPVFYCILTFRTLRTLFSGTDPQEGRRRRYAARAGDSSRDRQEHMTLDVVLLQDMVWHVVIDMIDINYMMFMSDPDDDNYGIMDTALIKAFPGEVESIRIASGVFVTLALFFHQQSFPTCPYVGDDGGATDAGGRRAGREFSGMPDGVSALSSSGPAARVARAASATVGSMGSFGGLTAAPSSESAQVQDMYTTSADVMSLAGTASNRYVPAQELYADVVKARKRSAIVSIILVDLPFFAIRTYMWSLSMSTQADSLPGQTRFQYQTNETLVSKFVGSSASGRPQLDKWWVKNILCMLLQAMQLRFVQQADLERSQTLRWWERGRAPGDVEGAVRRRRRSSQDPNLRQIWQEMDRSKWVAALQDTGAMSGEAEYSEPAPDEPDKSDGASHASSSPDLGSKLPGARHRRRSWLWPCCCCCCCSRRAKPRGAQRCRCCSCDCSHGVILHSLMGLVLGWLIAKVDFAQAFTDLVLGLGLEA